MSSRTIRELRGLISADWHANPRDYRNRTLLFWFRTCQWLMGDIHRPRVISYPLVLAYRIITEGIMGTELRPTTEVGLGLTIYHGVGLVVNSEARIGSNVKLRNGVVIGNRSPGGPCPTIEDGAELGANAVVIGGVRVGAGAHVGAGAVVLIDVPDGAVAVGNPARIVRTAGQ